ncbi:sortase [Patescibacteria group bacterium]
MLYRYVKAPPTEDIYPQQTPEFEEKKIPQKPRNPKNFKKLFPPILITLGSILIANVAWPIISHELIISPQIKREPIISPLQDFAHIQTIPNTRDTQIAQSDSQAEQVLGSQVDYTKAQNWFPTANFTTDLKYGVSKYTLSIPKVDVEDAEVIIGGESLNQSLIHFPGTSLPGQLGSPVIFGHSILRQFYAPQKSNKDRYDSIFSKIMTLKEEDEIFIDYDGIKYTYKVKERVEVQPEDVFILQQRLNNRELKLITCTPEGTYLRRGVIVAELDSIY